MSEQQLIPANYTEIQLKKFNITEARINELKEKYTVLTVKGADDKQGYTEVKAARKEIKNGIKHIEKTRKDLTKQVVDFKRTVDTEARRFKTLLQPIDAHLEAQEDFYEAERERVRQEKELHEIAKLQSRLNNLMQLGFVYTDNGSRITAFGVSVNILSLKKYSDEEYEKLYAQYTEKFHISVLEKQAEEQRLKEEEEKRQAIEAARQAEEASQATLRAVEAERERRVREELLQKQAAEQEAEKKRLEALARVQTEQEAALRAEREKLAAERDALEKQKQAAEQEVKAKIEAEQRKQREEADLKRRKEQEEKLVAEQKVREEKEAALKKQREEALKPDKEKLLYFAKEIHELAYSLPEKNIATEDFFASKEAYDIAREVHEDLMEVLTKLKDKIDKL